MSELKYKNGDSVIIKSNFHGHQFKIGEKVVIADTHDHSSYSFYDAKSFEGDESVWSITDKEIDHEATEQLNMKKEVRKPKEEAVKKQVDKPINSKVKVLRFTIRENVESLLEKYPDTRNDDKLLILAYWQGIDNIVRQDGFVDPKDVLTKATTPESITRARRLIQSEGMFMPTDEIVLARRSREGKMKKAIKQGEVV